jgi:hypothetical protein
MFELIDFKHKFDLLLKTLDLVERQFLI